MNLFFHPPRQAFSLVEVVLALGVFVFALVAIVGLFSVGLTSVGESERRLEAGNLAAQILRARLAAPKLPIPGCALPPLDLAELGTVPPTFGQAAPRSGDVFIDASGGVADRPQDRRFLVRYRLWRDAGFSPQADLVRIQLIFSWPPQAVSPAAENRYDVLTSFFVEP